MSDKLTVVEALCAVMRDVQGVSKSQRNPQQNYLFRGVDDVVNAVGPVLREHGVIVLPVLEKASLRDVQTSTGKPARESVVEVRYRFYGPAGDSIDAVVPGESMDHGDKGIAKAMSVAYRIVLLQALCIPTGDPDPDSQTYERDREERTPPTDVATREQLGNYRTLVNDINTAMDDDRLRELYQLVPVEFKKDAITAGQGNEARALILQRREALAAAPADEPGLTDSTRKHVFGLFRAVKLTDKDDQHKYATDTLKRQVESFTTLTEAEGLKLATALEGRKRAMGTGGKA